MAVALPSGLPLAARMDRLRELLALQAGVVSRRQALERGLVKHELDRLVRQRQLVRLHPGVYVDHTSTPTWAQLAWAAVLATWPSALTHASALRACEGPGRRVSRDSSIHVAVARHRNVRAPSGVVVHRLERFEERVLWNLGPPRLHYEDAALEVAASSPTEMEALGVLAAVVQSRRTTATRLLASAQSRPRLPRRAWTVAVLRDLAEGASSVLEQRYLTRVERDHGLQRARRQEPGVSSRGPVLRDVEYAAGLVVELDGRLFHDTATQRDADLDRDLDAALDGRETVRLSWGQVVDRPCWTAARIGTLLQRRGWKGTPVLCGPDCRVHEAARSIRRTQ